jgi:hypothetical protein
MKADQADRSWIIECETFDDKERRDEAQLLADFRAIRPELLGALYGAISHALAFPREAPKKLRLAGPTNFIYSAAPALGWDPDAALEALMDARDELAVDSISGDEYGQMVLRAIGEQSDGLTTQLQELVETEFLSYPDHRWPREWPARNARGLGRWLKHNAPNLERMGYIVDSFRTKHGKGWVISKCEPTWPAGPKRRGPK